MSCVCCMIVCFGGVGCGCDLSCFCCLRVSWVLVDCGSLFWWGVRLFAGFECV